MCGIVTAVSFNPSDPLDPAVLDAMTDVMAHRGPDGRGAWMNTSRTVGMGHRRLSIIDLSEQGKQPMQDASGRLTVSFNGEIYNYHPLRKELEERGHHFRSHSDTEVILAAYQEWGQECLHRFKGMFAFALWDMRENLLFVARDRFGIKPLVYYADSGRFICASEIGSIMKDPSVRTSMNPEALYHYLSLMTVPAPFTIYREIRKLEPGCCMTVKNGAVTTRRYWDISLAPPSSGTDAAQNERAATLLRQAVREHLVADVPVGVFLSGGIDSSLISSLAAELYGEKLHSYLVAFKRDGAYDESAYAKEVADSIGSIHHELDAELSFTDHMERLVAISGEPFAVSSGVALSIMCEAVSKHLKVVLSGDGGDELFGGYPWRHHKVDKYWDMVDCAVFRPFRRKSVASAPSPFAGVRWESRGMAASLLRLSLYGDEAARYYTYVRSLLIFNDAEKRRLIVPGILEAMDGVKTTERFLYNRLPPPAQGVENLQRWLAFDIRTTLHDEMLTKVDRASMAHGLEVRVPFLDHELAEFAINIPKRCKVSQAGEGKLMLRRMVAARLGQKISGKKKQGFNVPLKMWFAGSMKGYLKERLLDGALDGVFNRSAVSRIIDAHSESNDLSNQIMCLLGYSLWRGNTGR